MSSPRSNHDDATAEQAAQNALSEGIAFFDNGDWKKAIAAFKYGADNTTNNDSFRLGVSGLCASYHNLGTELVSKGKLEGALEEFDRSIVSRIELPRVMWKTLDRRSQALAFYHKSFTFEKMAATTSSVKNKKESLVNAITEQTYAIALLDNIEGKTADDIIKLAAYRENLQRLKMLHAEQPVKHVHAPSGEEKFNSSSSSSLHGNVIASPNSDANLPGEDNNKRQRLS